MNKKFKLSLVFAALSLSSSMVSAEPLALGKKNLLRDGDFEYPKVQLNNPHRFNAYSGFHGRNQIGAWYTGLARPPVYVHRNILHRFGLAGATGSQHLAVGSPSNVYQRLYNLDTNKNYTLSFDYALHTMANNGPTKLMVGIPHVNAITVTVDNKGDEQWKTAQYTFKPELATSTISITGVESPRSWPDTLVDNVSLHETKLNIVGVNLVNSSHRNTLTIQKNANVQFVTSDETRDGSVFQVTPKMYERCQFADYSKFGFKGNRENTVAINQGPLLPQGPTISILGDYSLESDKFTKSHPENKYYFVYGDFDKAQTRLIPSDLCRTGKGKFALQLVDENEHTADIKQSDKKAFIDVNSKPVALGDEYVIQAQKAGELFAVNRKDFMSCNLDDSAIKVGDFDANNANKLTLRIQEGASDAHADFKPGNTVYLVQGVDGEDRAAECKDGSKFSVRVSQ
ncbi:DUF642 domain-containing protein [Parashewanella tropica]|uniref:DUF642 domain-containing protein n=1 Tax=Parashewanella tropica TaxID=2547970 RepID=UPI001059C5BD|nr:DUF642 domain-containing protein [Parashewanella tropica]